MTETEINIRTVAIYNENLRTWSHGHRFSEVKAGDRLKLDFHSPYEFSIAKKDAYLNDENVWTIDVDSVG